jgi:putative hydrolase of the HAD superfamily
MPATLGGRPLEALLLDLDDTLLDNRTGLREAWEQAIQAVRSAHADLALEDLREQIARSTRWYWSDEARHAAGRLDLPRARNEILSHLLEAMGRPDPELAARVERIYSDCRDRQLQLAPGALEALAKLRAAVPRLALVTNGAAEAQRAKLRRFDLAGWFDHVQVEGEFGVGKPDARVYAYTLERVGASPEASLMAGDNFDADVLGALRAGLHAAWIDVERSGRAPRPSPRPHATLRSVVELVELLGVTG